jgi:hypothetical protein
MLGNGDLNGAGCGQWKCARVILMFLVVVDLLDVWLVVCLSCDLSAWSVVSVVFCVGDLNGCFRLSSGLEQ